MSRRADILVPCVIVAVVLLCVLAFLTPNGRDVPAPAPVKLNGVHAESFSIVSPEDWQARVMPHEVIGLTPRIGTLPRRYSAGMEVYKWGEQPNELGEFESTSFQGSPAFERTETTPGGSFESPPHFSYRLAFERDGEWFVLQYHAFLEFEELPEIIRQYLETFRIEAGPVKEAAVHCFERIETTANQEPRLV